MERARTGPNFIQRIVVARERYGGLFSARCVRGESFSRGSSRYRTARRQGWMYDVSMRPSMSLEICRIKNCSSLTAYLWDSDIFPVLAHLTVRGVSGPSLLPSSLLPRLPVIKFVSVSLMLRSRPFVFFRLLAMPCSSSGLVLVRVSNGLSSPRTAACALLASSARRTDASEANALAGWASRSA